MEPFFNLEEIEALREKAKDKALAVLSPQEASQASRFDPQQAGQLTAAEAAALEPLHKSYARQAGGALGALLRVSCELELASIDNLSFAGLFERLPDPTYLASFSTNLGARALLHVDLPPVFAALDLLLGGSGKEPFEARDVTEIEQEIFAPFSGLLCSELQAAWQSILNVDFRFEKSLRRSQAAAWLPSTDRILLLSFHLRVQEVRANLHIAVPSVVAATLLRKLLPPDPGRKAAVLPDQSRMREKLLGSRFEADLRLPRSPVSIGQVSALEPGQVLVLQVRADQPLEVYVAGKHMFVATAVRSGSRRGAQVQKAVSIFPQEKEQKEAQSRN